MSSSRPRVTYGQLEVLSEILSANTDVALGFNKAAHARARSRKVWEQVASSLNSMGEGAQKTWKEWSSYWVDYKGKLKKKARTDDGPSSAPNLNHVEEIFMRLIGPNSGSDPPGVRVEPFPDAKPVEQLLHERVPVPETEDAMATDPDLEPMEEQETQKYYVIGADDLEQSQSAQTPAEVTPANVTPAAAARVRSRRRRRGDPPRPVSVSDARRSVINSNNESIEIMRGILTELRRLTDLVAAALERVVDWKPGSLKWNTDGSKFGSEVGCGIYGEAPRTAISVNLEQLHSCTCTIPNY